MTGGEGRGERAAGDRGGGVAVIDLVVAVKAPQTVLAVMFAVVVSVADARHVIPADAPLSRLKPLPVTVLPVPTLVPNVAVPPMRATVSAVTTPWARRGEQVPVSEGGIEAVVSPS